MGCTSSKEMNVVPPEHVGCNCCKPDCIEHDNDAMWTLNCGHMYHGHCIAYILVRTEGMEKKWADFMAWVDDGKGVCPIECPACLALDPPVHGPALKLEVARARIAMMRLKKLTPERKAGQ